MSGHPPDVAQPPQHNPDSNDDAVPGTTPGLEPGGGVAPGDTPPTAGTMSGTAPDAHKAPNMGPVSGNRTPMIITLALIGLMVLLVLGYGIAQIFQYLNKQPGEEQQSGMASLSAPLRP